MYSEDVLALAKARGITAEELPLIINGCSGGLSAVYALAFDRTPSCEECCYLHDLLYQLGGTAEDRKRADKALRDCAAGAGSFPAGWVGVTRKVWRHIRAALMYGAVRLFGWQYWTR